MVSRVRHESEKFDLWNASTADTHYIQGEGEVGIGGGSKIYFPTLCALAGRYALVLLTQ